MAQATRKARACRPAERRTRRTCEMRLASLLAPPFEILHRVLMLLGGFSRAEGAQVSALPRLRIHFPRIEAVLSGFQFADHVRLLLCVAADQSAVQMSQRPE